MPLVSVCVPTCNGARYLSDCLESILAQTFGDLEVIVADDCSTDETLEIVERFQSRDARVRLHRNSCRLGIPGNWTRTMGLARGEWIKVMGQDDLLSPDCLARMLDVGNASMGLILSDRDVLSADADEETRWGHQKVLDSSPLRQVGTDRTFTASEVSDMVVDHLDVNFIGEPVTALFRASLAREYGSFHPRLIQFCDYEFLARIGVNRGFSWLATPLATFRLHAAGQTAQNLMTRGFRAVEIEALLLLTCFAVRPEYASVREAALRRRPPIDIGRTAARRVLRMQRLTRRVDVKASALKALTEDEYVRQVVSAVPFPVRWLRRNFERPAWMRPGHP